MTALLCPRDCVDQVGAVIANVGAYRFGEEGLGEARALDGPCFVAVPTTIEWIGANELGTNPRTLATIRAGFDVHVWGRSDADVWAMLACWLRASREQFGGLSRVRVGSGRYLASASGARGVCLVQSIAYELRIENPTIPTSPTGTPGSATSTSTLTETEADTISLTV